MVRIKDKEVDEQNAVVKKVTMKDQGENETGTAQGGASGLLEISEWNTTVFEEPLEVKDPVC